jgi:hypothetical protein
MAAGVTYDPNDVQPLQRINAIPDAVRLPAGVDYPAGSVLGARTDVAANEVQTLTLTTVSGTNIFAFTGLPAETSKVYSATTTPPSSPANAAGWQALLDDWLGAGNCTVAGSPGGPYTVTFIGKYAQLDVPLLIITTGAGSIAVAETTPGSPGRGGAGIYASGASNGTQTGRYVLRRRTRTDSKACIIRPSVDSISGTSDSTDLLAPVWSGGDFLVSQLPNFVAGMLPAFGSMLNGPTSDPTSAVRLGRS